MDAEATPPLANACETNLTAKRWRYYSTASTPRGFLACAMVDWRILEPRHSPVKPSRLEFKTASMGGFKSLISACSTALPFLSLTSNGIAASLGTQVVLQNAECRFMCLDCGKCP